MSKSAQYSLNRSGLDHLISAPSMDEQERFLFSLLSSRGEQPATIEQFVQWTGMSRSQVAATVYKLLRQGWLDNVEGDKPGDASLSTQQLSEHLSRLSSRAEVILADRRGLVIASSGFDRQAIDHLAATAARLLTFTEATRAANPWMCQGRPWFLRMDCGNSELHIHMVKLNRVDFVFVVGGLPQLDNSAYVNLLARLARRYGNGA